MTVAVQQDKLENSLPQEKVDTKIPQEKPDTKVLQQQQKPPEKKAEDEPQEDPNWKAFREARKKDRAEREAAERRAAEKEAEAAALKAAMEAAFSKAAPTPQAYQQHYGIASDEQEETEDQRIEKKVNAAIAAREAAAEKSRLEREQREYPVRLQRDFPDFQNMIAQENLDYLDYHYPEVSRPLQRLPDGYDKWSDIYYAVKKFVPNNANAKKDSAKAQANLNKPKSISSQGVTQPSEALKPMSSYQEVESRRAARYAEMQRIMKGV